MLRAAAAVLLSILIGWPAGAGADELRLAGRWVLNHDLTREEQPDGPEQRALLDKLPRAGVSVGGVPLPRTGNAPLPQAIGSPRNPAVLETTELSIEALGDDRIRLGYDGGRGEELIRGDDQGLVTRWSDTRLTSRYETTRRKVSQQYELRRDGRLLVTVKLNPNRGPTVVHKRVFDRMPDGGGA
ncbi:MAG TPA: hypothetical protein VF210_10510 [Pseudomonadales bacterium]